VDPDQLEQLVAAFAATTSELQASADRTGGDAAELEALLERLTVAAADSVPGADYVGITMVDPERGLISRAPSSPQIRELDRLQAELGEGPCVQASTEDTSQVVLVEDFAHEQRWPRFTAAARARGVGGLLSYAAAPRGAVPAALNFYATRPATFDRASRAVAAMFATHAGVAIYGTQRIAHLRRALDSRDVIGQAKGILMERLGVDAEQAFHQLVRASQDTNLKLVDVARWLTQDTPGGQTRTR
jgi:hypothetical protein